MAASALKLCGGKKAESTHFLKTQEYEGVARETVRAKVSNHLTHCSKEFLKNDDPTSLIKVLVDCEGSIAKKLAKLLEGAITNEAVLRFVLGDSIRLMICNYWGCCVLVV